MPQRPTEIPVRDIEHDNLLKIAYGKDIAQAIVRSQPVVRNVVRMAFKRGVPPWVRGDAREILSWANKEIAKIRKAMPPGCLTERAFLKHSRFNVVAEHARQDGFPEFAAMLDALHREMNLAMGQGSAEVAEPSRIDQPDRPSMTGAIL